MSRTPSGVARRRVGSAARRVHLPRTRKGMIMADMKPYCRPLSDWEVEQAYVDWDGGAGKAISALAKEAGTTPKTLERAFRRLEERRDGTAHDEPAPTSAAEAAPCSLALVRTMPDGSSYRLELGMRSDALKLFAEIAARVMA